MVAPALALIPAAIGLASSVGGIVAGQAQRGRALDALRRRARGETSAYLPAVRQLGESIGRSATADPSRNPLAARAQAYRLAAQQRRELVGQMARERIDAERQLAAGETAQADSLQRGLLGIGAGAASMASTMLSGAGGAEQAAGGLGGAPGIAQRADSPAGMFGSASSGAGAMGGVPGALSAQTAPLQQGVPSVARPQAPPVTSLNQTFTRPQQQTAVPPAFSAGAQEAIGDLSGGMAPAQAQAPAAPSSPASLQAMQQLAADPAIDPALKKWLARYLAGQTGGM